MEVTKLKLIDGIWTNLEVIMITKKGTQTEHKSIIRWADIKYNQELEDELFTQRRLIKGS